MPSISMAEINVLSRDIRTLEEDWGTIVANADDPKKLCDFLEEYLKKQYMVEREIFKSVIGLQNSSKEHLTIYQERTKNDMYQHHDLGTKVVNIDANNPFLVAMADIKNYNAERAKINELSELKNMVDDVYKNLTSESGISKPRNR